MAKDWPKKELPYLRQSGMKLRGINNTKEKRLNAIVNYDRFFIASIDTLKCYKISTVREIFTTPI